MAAVTYSDFTGLRNDRPQWRFENTDLAIAQNVDIDNSGGIARRPGYANLNAAPSHSLYSDGTTGLIVSDSVLNLINQDYSYTPLLQLKSNGRISFVKVNDRIYFSSETDSGVYENGAVRSWGLPVPPLPGVIQTAGNMPEGTYQFVLTYLRQDGQESGARAAGVITVPDGSGLIFGMPKPPADPQIVGCILYMTTPNGATLYSAMTVPIAATQVNYLNNTLDLVMPLLTQFRGPPPPGQKVKYYRGHIMNAVGDMIYPSESLAYELFDLRKGFTLDSRVTMIATIEDKDRPGDTQGMASGIFVGTIRSTGVMVGKDPLEYQYVPKVDYGVVEGADTLVDGSLYGDDSSGGRLLPMWLSRQGVCVGMPEMVVKNLTRTRYGFKTGDAGAAMFQPGPNKFIATSRF